jgi:hypothetical protein
MKIKKQFIRNHAVPCMWSRFGFSINDRYALNGKYSSVKELIKYHPRDEILSIVCTEEQNYDFLKDKYLECLKNSKSNDYFVETFKLNRSYNIFVNDNIYIYYFQDRIRLRSRKIFPWDYPHCITEIGHSYNYSASEIIKDFLRLDYVRFYLKYNENIKIKKPFKLDDISQKNGVFNIADILSFSMLDSHVTLHTSSKTSLPQNRYIADVWNYSDEEITRDLISLPIIKFGRKYHAYWI